MAALFNEKRGETAARHGEIDTLRVPFTLRQLIRSFKLDGARKKEAEMIVSEAVKPACGSAAAASPAATKGSE